MILIRITFDYTKKDYLSFQKHHLLRPLNILVFILLFLFVTLIAFMISDSIWGRVLFIGGMLSIYFFVILLLLWINLYHLDKKVEGTFVTQTIEISEEGLRNTNAYDEYFRKWSAIQELVETKSHFFVKISSAIAIVSPKRAFASKKEEEEFKEKVTTYLQRAKKE